MCTFALQDFQKVTYADDLALSFSFGKWKAFEGTLSQDMTTLLVYFQTWKAFEGTLSQDMTTLLVYFQTWKLKLSHTKTVMATFHLNTQKAKRELNVYNFVQPYLFCGKTGQITHVLSPSSGIAQKFILVHHTTEATCRLRMGCWCQSTMYICPLSGLLNNRVLHSTSLVSQCSHLPYRQCFK